MHSVGERHGRVMCYVRQRWGGDIVMLRLETQQPFWCVCTHFLPWNVCCWCFLYLNYGIFILFLVHQCLPALLVCKYMHELRYRSEPCTRMLFGGASPASSVTDPLPCGYQRRVCSYFTHTHACTSHASKQFACICQVESRANTHRSAQWRFVTIVWMKTTTID